MNGISLTFSVHAHYAARALLLDYTLRDRSCMQPRACSPNARVLDVGQHQHRGKERKGEESLITSGSGLAYARYG